MTGEIKISIRAYAKQLNVDEKAVRKAIEKGKIKKGYDKRARKIIASHANKEWGFIHKNPKPQRGVSKAKVVEKLNKKNASQPGEDKPKENDFLDDDNTYHDLISKIKLNANLPYSEIVRRKEILAAANDRMKLEELNGLLVRKDEVNKALRAAGDQLKKELLNLPNRITEDIRTASNKVEAINIFTIELNQVLQNIASLGLP